MLPHFSLNFPIHIFHQTARNMSYKLSLNRTFPLISNSICRKFSSLTASSIHHVPVSSASQRLHYYTVKLPHVRSMATVSSASGQVLFEDVDTKGIITLNRPKALNALTEVMINEMLPALKKWESEKRLVIVKGSGEKAFCAGGDVVHLTKKETREDPNIGDFFKVEYTLNHLIGTYQIPYIAFITGIVMGGGAGISINGKFTVASEKSMFAMPETGIGLFPDVGGSYFLPRLGGGLGMFLALTGHRLRGMDLVRAGLATHFCPHSKVAELQAALLALPQNTNHDHVSTLLNTFNDDSPDFSLAPHLKDIKECFTAPSLNEILDRLAKSRSEFCREQLRLIETMSPTSVAITHEQIRRGESLSLKQCLQMEYRMVLTVLRHTDFYEGVRARLVEKDNKPVWQPATLAGVDDALVAEYFAMLPEDRELKLRDN